MKLSLSFGSRLLLCLAAPACLLVLALGIALAGAHTTQSIYRATMRTEVHLVSVLADLRAQGLRSGQLMRDSAVAPGDKAARSAALDALAKFAHALATVQEATGAGAFKKAIGELAELAQKHIALQKKVLELIVDNPGDVLLTILEQETPAWNLLHGELERIIDEAHASADAASAKADAAASRSLILSAALAAAAVVTATGLGWLLRRTVAREIGADPRAVRASLEQIAGGDLRASLRIDDTSRQSLLGGVAAMSVSLQNLVRQVRVASESIELASAEVAAGNLDMSQRTESTAANLQETVGALGQLTSNLRDSAFAAATANDLARSAAAVADRGGELVSEVVSTMDDINDSARHIGEIIGVIDGIAFQTNVLALNAAVEAARAGDQGRGFAVVASEVRMLAQRSASAAREVKDLINNSVERVNNGTSLVKDAGQTIQQLVVSVAQVRDAIGLITQATSEQSDGLARVNGRVVQLDAMTQQNAALVEQGAAAAQSLKEQAVRLADAVALFRLAETPTTV